MVCANYRKKRKKVCESHQIKNVDIEAALLYSIQQIKESKKEYEQAITRMNKHDSFIQKLFEDNVEGKISNERFAKMSATYESEQNELQERVVILESIINEAKEKSANVDSFFELVKKYTDIKELDAEIIRTFIEKVYVYQNEKLWSRDTKKLKIVFNFIGNIQIPSSKKTA